jgi:ABC-type nitrate/sulfonate/bicarbonate transport system substrate-binding protein
MREASVTPPSAAGLSGSTLLTRPQKRSLLTVAAVLAVGAVLTACGGGDGKNAAGAGSDRPKTTVTIGKAVDTIGFTTVDVARAKGYFAKQGVDAKSQLLGGSSTAFAALQSGSVQFVTASSTALLNAKAKGVPLQAVASLDYGVSLQLIASNNWIKAHNLSANQPLATVMKGLVGATLGVISTTDLTYNHYLMQQAGVDQNKFKYITLKTQAAALAALQHGQIDAFLLSPPNSFLAQAQGGSQIIATLHSVPLLAKMTYDTLIVDSNYAKAHPDVVNSVATAMAMADNTMAKDPNSVLSVEKQHYPEMSDDVILQSLRYVTFAKDGKMTQEGWQGAKDEVVQTGNSSVANVDVSPNGGTWTNDFIKTGDLAGA